MRPIRVTTTGHFPSYGAVGQAQRPRGLARLGLIAPRTSRARDNDRYLRNSQHGHQRYRGRVWAV